MKALTLIVFFLLSGCSKKYLNRNYSAKHQLVDISSERSFDKLTPKMKKQARKLKKKGYKIKKKKEGYFAIKGKKKFLLIDGYQCKPY
jgi:hypothetical protein